MKPNHNPDDPILSRALREARSESPLPPRFQEGVWRRIAEAESPVRDEASISWLDVLAAWALATTICGRATAAVLIIAGATLGAREASQTARTKRRRDMSRRSRQARCVEI